MRVRVCAVDRVACNLPKSQQGFLNFVVKPIYQAVVDVFPQGQVRRRVLTQCIAVGASLSAVGPTRSAARVSV